MATNLKKIEELAVKFDNDVLAIGTELKRVQSVKCRLKKQKGKKSYEAEMTEVLAYEQSLKEARALLEPKDKPVTAYEQTDVDKLDYDETVKAIRSIQSKKTLSRWLTDEEGNNDEFKKAVEIEKMLLEHRKKTAPVEPEHVRKSEVQKIIEALEDGGKLSQAKVIELLKELV